MPAVNHVVRAGHDGTASDGRAASKPLVLLIHGSAADHTTWSIQLASRTLKECCELVAYDRRSDVVTVEAHAADALELLDPDRRAILVGSSFGAVIALEVLRGAPERVAGAVLIEPPMAASDDAPALAAPRAFLEAYDRTVATDGGEAAAELFLRTVLGAAAYERMPKAYQARSKSKWREIRADSEALLAYRPRYAELARIATPVLLVGGQRSAGYFRPTLEALHAALPAARLEILANAGHMLHAEAHRSFDERLIGFARTIADAAPVD